MSEESSSYGLRALVPALSRVFGFIVVLLAANCALAQNLAPRTYWPAPKGTQLLILGYGYQWGDVVTDPSLPVIGVNSNIDSGVVGYQRTLGWFGRTTNLQISVPFASASTRGELEGQPAERDVSGLGDVSASLTVNLRGAPSLGPPEFQSFRANPRPIIAASIKIVAPTGQYDEDKIINIGTNRWATRLRLGYIKPLPNRWVLEASVGTWFFEDNDEFIGVTREQDPITAFDLSMVRRIRPGFWISLDGTYYAGGRTTVDETLKADFQRNVRLGFALAYPFKQRHGLKFSYTSGVSTRSGGDFDSVGVTYVYRL